ncbi:MAG: hypothetical protein A2428_01405 [Bdellovibrionales bacterium RIFOXYC1_FULL_54_43]|nr:MAG: hypothetical protein A2428_01405 [Bdellovibrionales bacterium RIFOXYC1_FULL_54_43]OFZ85256.1 MAG: hypothetical protein A2603_08160 [Bdellovibrionales bacterium RIFOXYD1_FULL_55_31]
MFFSARSAVFGRVLFFLFFLFVSNASATWDECDLSWAEKFSQKPIQFNDSHVASVWGNIRATLRPFLIPEYELLQLENPEFARGSIPVVLSIARNRERAPLLILLPGIFSDPGGLGNLKLVGTFARLGYDVAVLPNPFGKSYIHAGPKHNPGSIHAEARVVLQVVQTIKNRIGPSRVLRTELMGISYGAFLSAVSLALEQDDVKAGRSRVRLFDHHVTLLSPPVVISKGRDHLDAIMDQEVNRYFRFCAKFQNLSRIGLDFVTARKQADLDDASIRCSPGLVGFARFQADLISTAIALDRVRGTHKVPSRENEAEYQRWVRAFRFRTFLQDFTPDILAQRGTDEETLPYWFNRLDSEGQSRVRILTTDDDFLNAREDWNLFSTEWVRGSLIRLPWGGHLGFFGIVGFNSFFQKIFREK